MAPLGQQLMVPSGSPIHNVAQLRGTRIGVNALHNIGVLLVSSALSDNDLGAVQNSMETYAGLPRHTVQIASLPDYPLQTNANLLQRVANLMEQFGMTTQEFDVSQIIRD